ncbi:hypothetical protein GCM10022393_32990 [Aquimarina addita]|uniref:Secretion system C-terminal sorting domain-containing protein n=1 Tax=Aquimarina addita TaxID=870485 RepID=A0ABP6UTB5_9FLAO
MKTKIQFLFLFALCFSTGKAQETTVNISMGAGYTNQVFYKLSTDTENSYLSDSWDVAFLRTDNFDFAIRMNDANGAEVFEASNDPNDWSNIDIANEASWTKLYNSDTNWKEGAFQKGSATYGWGEYNIANHHVEGTVIFVIKYADGSYRKFINDDFFGGYTFRYATWDGMNWSTDQTATVSNTNNPDHEYNYYSFTTDAEVIAEPVMSDWDFKFTRYYTELPPDATPYLVTGIMHSDQVTVAQNDETGGSGDTSSLNYSTDINTIGYDWKSFTGTGFSVNSDMAYYVKYANETVYRVYFTSFSGSSTGDVSFNYENITNVLGIDDVTTDVSFGVYPNPSTNKKVSIIYDVNTGNAPQNEVAIYTLAGKKVYSEHLNTDSGFYNKELNLFDLQTGIYILHFISGDHYTTKKLVLN